jgi:hypothetical protein
MTKDDPGTSAAFEVIAEVMSELNGPYIRFVAAELDLEGAGDRVSAQGLTKAEINKLVYKYIGVNNGYLGDFVYRTHREFYIDLDLPIDPTEWTGTTREKFMAILGESIPLVQARIIEGILRRYPVGSTPLRTEELRDDISRWISRLRGTPVVEAPSLGTTSQVVERALRDVEELLRTSGAASGVDRIHTALHGYLRAVCGACDLSITDDETVPALLKKLRESHPAFQSLGPRPDDILRVLRAFGTIVDSLNPLRNKTSVAHPNEELLPEPEAMLVVNGVRTILHYLDSKVRAAEREP